MTAPTETPAASNGRAAKPARRELPALRSSIEDLPTRVLLCDSALDIRYANKASWEGFRELAGHLTVEPANVLGAPIGILGAALDECSDLAAAPGLPPRSLVTTVGPQTLEVTVRGLTDDDGHPVGLIVCWVDVTERLNRDAAQEAVRVDTVAVNAVLQAIQNARTVDEAASVALDTVREAFGWAYGSYWTIEEDNALHFRTESGDAGPEFRAVTLAASFREGVGLSGRAWRTRDLFFTQDIGEMTDCVRAPVAQKVGVKSGVCFPIFVGGAVVGTMDFFAKETLSPSKERLDALRNVGRLVSQAMERLDTAAQEAADQLRSKVDVVLGIVSAAAAGDLTQDIPVEGDDAIGMLASGLSALLTTLRSSLGDIGRTAEGLAGASQNLTQVSDDMGRGATQTSDRASSASAASEQVSAIIQSVAAGAEEMSLSIREIAKNAADASTVATNAVSVAGAAKGTVASLGESSAEIGKVIKVITSIAQQTNLLALNATIEAARAGEAGKGFAVVANEVKELAKETARATEDISQMIDAIQSDTRGAVGAIEEIGGIIDRINDIQTTIASAVEEQTATTNEIARSVTEAATGANGIASDVADVAQAANSTQAGAEETLGAATTLAGMATELKRLLAQFQY